MFGVFPEEYDCHDNARTNAKDQREQKTGACQVYTDLSARVDKRKYINPGGDKQESDGWTDSCTFKSQQREEKPCKSVLQGGNLRLLKQGKK